MNPAERAIRRLDRAQQHFGPAGFVVAVVRKYGDDRGSSLAALLAFYGFVSLFPLLLLLVTLLAFFGRNDHAWIHHLENDVFSQFPKIGSQLSDNIHVLHRGSVPALILGLLVVLWGCQGAMQSAQFVQAEVWNIPGVVRPNYWVRLARTFLMIGTLGVFFVVSTVLAAVVTVGHQRVLVAVGSLVVTVLANVALFAVDFRILTPKLVAWSSLLPGAIAGGLGWTALQYVGGELVAHTLRNTSPVYGVFAIVLGLLAWIYLGAELTVYAAEINVVTARRLWPRSLVQPPLTRADERVLDAIVLQGKRRPEQRVATGYGAAK